MTEQMLSSILLGLGLLVLLLVVVYYRGRRGPISLSNRLLVAFVVVAAISIALVVGTIVWRTRLILTEQRGEDLVELAQLSSQRLAEQLTAQVIRLESLSQASEVTSYASFATRTLDSMSPSKRNAEIQAKVAEWNNPESALRLTVPWSAVGIVFDDVIENFPIFNL